MSNVERGGLDGDLLLEGLSRMPSVLSQLGFDGLREGQEKPITSIMSGQDTICVLPTGRGKTACFTIPGLCHNWRVIVISPLIALMRDQVQSMWRNGISAAQINSEQTESENNSVLRRWMTGEIQFLYVAPERLSKPSFENALKHVPPEAVVVDECFTGDVEILTDQGFIRFDALDAKAKVAQYDAGRITFVTPTDWIRREHHGRLIRMWSDRGVDLTMTENHELLLRNKKSGELVKKKVKDAKFNVNWDIPTSAEYEGDDFPDLLTPEDKFRIAFQADGSFHSKTSALFSFTKERKISRFISICRELELDLSRPRSVKPEKSRFIALQLGFKISKRLDEVFDLQKMDKATARSFVFEVAQWDGSDLRNGKTPSNMLYYSSVEEANTDFVQAVCVLAGFKTLKRVQRDDRKESHRDVHRLFIDLNRDHIGTQRIEREVLDSDGELVYCVRVPSGNIVVRRNGKVAVTGNCHCASDWSDNFRPSYVDIGRLISEYNPRVVAAFTATATDEVIADVRRVFHMENANLEQHYERRSNLNLSSSPFMDDADFMSFVRDVSKKGSTIVYCPTKAQTEEYAVKLSDFLRKEVVYYHGGMDRSSRRNNQDLFMTGKVPIIVCTCAFGMGVDKSDIRAVIHREAPGSPEDLAQEIGRAGRDGEESICHSFYSDDGLRIQTFFCEEGNPRRSAIESVYYALMAATASGSRKIKLTGKQLGAQTQLSGGLVGTCLRALESAGVVKRYANPRKIGKILWVRAPKSALGSDAGFYETYQEVWRDLGTDPDPQGYISADLDMVADEIGVSRNTVTSRLSKWREAGNIEYKPPYNGKITEVIGDISLVDFDRLEKKAIRDRARIEDVQTYLRLPDDEKHAFLEAYFNQD